MVLNYKIFVKTLDTYFKALYIYIDVKPKKGKAMKALAKTKKTDLRRIVSREVENFFWRLKTEQFHIFHRGIVHVGIIVEHDEDGNIMISFSEKGEYCNLSIELEFFEFAEERRYPKAIWQRAERYGYSTAFDFLCAIVYNLNYIKSDEFERISFEKQIEYEQRFKKLVCRYLDKIQKSFIRQVMEKIA